MIQRFCIITAGSSPRVRGTDQARFRHGQQQRFIPARAGNSLVSMAELIAEPVHPRACGEQTGGLLLRGLFRNRFIPAACGEQLDTDGHTQAITGSSPRVRGTALRDLKPVVCRRFIPARAGNRRLSRPLRSSSSVHPRACGEQAHSTRVFASRRGSSPRVRGTASKDPALINDVRFIPARAGNSAGLSGKTSPASVHPRACGEQTVRQRNRSLGVGSSPRVRGTVLC